MKSVFTSNLQRAYQTANTIVDAQSSQNNSPGAQAYLNAVQLADLREKDFGSSEGKKFGNKASGLNTDAQSDSETRDAMKCRIDRFLDIHLSPALGRYASEKVCVVVVAHGIILGVLLRALLSRYPTKQSDALYHHGEVLATWSNTGVLQIKVDNTVDSPRPASPRRDLRAVVQFTNNVDHLEGLKKTRGGIGSAKFDSKQRTMDSFFGPSSKKRKLGEPNE